MFNPFPSFGVDDRRRGDFDLKRGVCNNRVRENGPRLLFLPPRIE